jgi:ADP-heptose:LPS heptosyltransferase
LILPCCIGDVVLATATLNALRRGYPLAHITWAVGSWSKPAIEHHPLLDAILDTGSDALPVKSLRGFWRFVRHLRAGNFDMAVSLVRSPLMSLAVLLSGIPHRVGLDSAGRGFGYIVRAPIDPLQARHEADIYLDAARMLGLDVNDCWANVPVREADKARVKSLLTALSVHGEGEQMRYVVVNPAGGRNPGMLMDTKRWPAANFGQLADRLAAKRNARVILLGGPQDGEIVRAVQSAMQTPAQTFIGDLSFGEIAALANMALCYIGNDTGLTHLAAAAGAKTVMILGPSDPARYAPFTPESLALWKPSTIVSGGVAQGTPADWDWSRDGIGVDAAAAQIMAWLKR